MKKETLKAMLLLMGCSGFGMLMWTVVAQFWGLGFAQNPAAQLPPTFSNLPQNELNYMPIQQQSASQPPSPMIVQSNEVFGQVVPRPNMPNLSSNAVLPNQGQTTYNMANGEVNIPFQLDTSRLLAFSAIVDNQWQTITVLDPANQTLAVYQVSLLANGQNAGKCYLRSVRNIAGDLKFDEYEATKPKPSEVRAIIEQKNHVEL
ncbi:MAG: hypothetical protein LBJ67_06185 [Planctomycetaceae bacterium]|nr:hypothetical protein [Planctomycetaceae bacterium]